MTNKIYTLFVTLLLIITKSYGQYCTDNSQCTEVLCFDNNALTIAKIIQYDSANGYQGNHVPFRMDTCERRLSCKVP
jgi:hypothetical protein